MSRPAASPHRSGPLSSTTGTTESNQTPIQRVCFWATAKPTSEPAMLKSTLRRAQDTWLLVCIWIARIDYDDDTYRILLLAVMVGILSLIWTLLEYLASAVMAVFT